MNKNDDYVVGDVVVFYSNRRRHVGKITSICSNSGTCDVYTTNHFTYSFIPLEYVIPILTEKKMDELVSL